VEEVKKKYGKHFELIMKDLHQTDDLRVYGFGIWLMQFGEGRPAAEIRVCQYQRDDGGDAAMRKMEIEFFRKYLKTQLEELTKKSDAAIADLLNTTVNSADPLDRTSLELERDFTLRLLDRENKLIVKIKKALGKIDDGVFGICEDCGDEIDIERLRLRPVTELCIGCKTRQERLERLTCE
jgi:DnaK suppressor protein